MGIGFWFHDDDETLIPQEVVLSISTDTPSEDGNKSYSCTLPSGGHAGPGWELLPNDLDLTTEYYALGPVMDVTYTITKTDNTQSLTLTLTAEPIPNPFPDPAPNGVYTFKVGNGVVSDVTGTDLAWDPSSGWVHTTAGGDFTVTSHFTLRYTTA